LTGAEVAGGGLAAGTGDPAGAVGDPEEGIGPGGRASLVAVPADRSGVSRLD